MDESDIHNIVVNYVKFVYASKEENDEYFWAWDKIIDLIDDEPENTWIIIKKIIDFDSSLKIIADLAAGPLESLLARYGEQFIDRAEEEAKKNPDFAKLLGGVWQNAMSDEVWERIQKVCDKSWDE